ncbi:MAG: PAS domain S-box protein [Candidatus Hermodarchaeota archaeon]
MIGLLLVRFDPLFGPSIFLKAPESLDNDLIKDIPSLIELPTKGVFIHIFKKIKTANLLFKQPNKFARGGYESFLITIITDIKTQISLMLANKLLEGFANYIINLEDAYLAFDYEPKDHKADPDKLKVIENFFFSYYESIKPVLKTLEMAEQRYQTLFQAARDAIFIVNRDTGVIVDVNLEGERLVEKTKEEIVSIKALDLELFDEGLVDPTMVQHLINQPPPIISRIKKSSKKQLYLEVNINEIELGDEYFIQYLFHDLSDIHVVEEKLKEHANKIDTLNKFISITNQASDLNDLLKKTVDYFTDFLNLNGCCIYLVDKIQGIAKIKAHKNLPQFFFEQNDNIKSLESPYDIVFAQGVALFNENFPEITKKFFKGDDSINGAVIPLFSKFEILGSINMILNQKANITVEEMELIITIGLEIGTAIEKMQNQENLMLSEAKNAILLKHIPFSIFRISIDGIFQDIKLDKKIEKILEISTNSQDLIGKSIDNILPDTIAEEALKNIETALDAQTAVEMKFSIPYQDKKIIFRSDIIPIGKNEVLAFLQNLTRTW